MNRVRQLWSVAAFLLMPAASFLSPLLVIPAVTSRYGSQGWASFAVAQSLGASIGLATEMGWGVVGPQRVAGLEPEQAVQQYRWSITSRTLTAVPGMVVAGAAAFYLVTDFRIAATLLAIAFAGQAMTPSWYFVGIGKPMYIFWSEALPRMLIALICGVVIRQGAPILVYSAFMLFTVPFAQLVAQCLIGRDARIRRSDWAQAWPTTKAQSVMGLGRAASVVYTALPISIVQAVAPSSTAVYAASERLMRMAWQVIAVLPLRLQSWVGSGTGMEKASRIKQSRKYMMTTGVIAGVLFAALAPLVARFVFSGQVHIPYYVSAASGLLLATISTSASLGLSLVAQRQANDITKAIIPSACVGLVVIGPMAYAMGPVGAIAGALLAEYTGIAVQAFYLRRGSARWLVSLTADEEDLTWK